MFMRFVSSVQDGEIWVRVYTDTSECLNTHPGAMEESHQSKTQSSGSFSSLDIWKKSYRAAEGSQGTLKWKDLKELCEENVSHMSDVPSPPFPVPHDTCSSQCPWGLAWRATRQVCAPQACLPCPCPARHSHKQESLWAD